MKKVKRKLVLRKEVKEFAMLAVVSTTWALIIVGIILGGI